MRIKARLAPVGVAGYCAIACICASNLPACGGRAAHADAAPDRGAGSVYDSSAVDVIAPSDVTVADATAPDSADEDASPSFADGATLADATPDDALADAGSSFSAGWAWTYAGGDSINGTPPVLAAFGDGIVFAGASSNPAVVGVAGFPNANVTAEPFVARLEHDGGSMWAAPLNGAGMPAGIAATPDGAIVVAAPWLPGVQKLDRGDFGTDIYLGKFAADGTPTYEKDLALPSSVGSFSGLSVNGAAVDSSGAIYVVGQILQSNGTNAIAFVKVDASGDIAWVKAIPGDGPGYEMLAYAVVVLPGGDVVIGGDVNGHVDFGGGARSTLVAGTYETMAYLARFTSDGQWVSDVTFGTGPASTALALAATPTGDVLVGGWLAGTATFGALTLSADLGGATSYVADLQSTWSGRWGAFVSDGGLPLLIATPVTSAVAVDALGQVHATGVYDGRRLLANYVLTSGEKLPDFVVDVGDAGSGATGTSLAVDSAQSVWVSGLFGERATFGAITLDGTAPLYAGVPISTFIARFDPSGI